MIYMFVSIKIPFLHVYFSGNHTFAAIQGKESYQHVRVLFLSVVIGEINSLVTSKSWCES